MFWRRISVFLLCLVTFAIPIEHKYDKIFRFFSLKLIPPDVALPNFFEKKIYFYPSDIIALCLLFVALFGLRVSLKDFFIPRGSLFLWVVLFFSFLSILLSPLSHYPIVYFRLLHFATPILLFCFVANAYRKTKDIRLGSLLIGCLSLAALIQSGIAIAQYAIQGPLGLRLLGEPNHFASFMGTSGRAWIFEPQKLGEWIQIIRPSGTMPHANVLGGFICISILSVYPFFFARRWRVLFAMILPILFFAMTLTYSRSALYSWLLGSLVWLGLHVKNMGFRSTFGSPAVRLLLCTICASVLFTTVILHEQLGNRGGIANYNLTARGSDAIRISSQNLALKIIKDYPFQGTGFQQYSIRAIDYTKDDPSPDSLVAPHNIYLHLAAETGLFSLFAFLSFIFFLLWTGLKSPYTPRRGSLICMFIALLFIGGCDFYPLLFQQGKLLFFLSTALLASHAIETRTYLLKEAA